VPGLHRPASADGGLGRWDLAGGRSFAGGR
jgi:hypothetical protein